MISREKIFPVLLLCSLSLTLFVNNVWASKELDAQYSSDLKKIYRKFSTVWGITKKSGSEQGVTGKLSLVAYDVTDDDVNNTIKNKYKLLWVHLFAEKDNFAMNLRLDKWFLIDSKGKKHKAINSINYYDQNFYFFLPSSVKELFMFYPSYAMMEIPTSFFLFFEASVNTKNFKKIIYKNAYLDRSISIRNPAK